ncbi:XrtA-associated tyrosine autokinase [Sediminicurvatus halobius]|uniref:non-specific protein-tyrosine kinase n=1 Tax=Sediminicurvatus halobius TaxID=2182432 RepID=A0A2U2N0P9_9GAMM|nr:XrtA-associated tyrosine autokinase [Spiribacter halobius]PWG62690.1 protein tyrosine kinase [Spiribacter halobius]UEX77359.1 XrtA-associated tyrosine autokinase [Spiribacter halobius]
MNTIERAMRKAAGAEPLPESTEREAPRQEAPEPPPHFRESSPEPGIQPAVDRPAHPLDPERMRRLGLLTPDEDRGRVAEEFRTLKRPLIRNAFGQNGPAIRNGNLIMVTSALPREGKTFCTINLALSITREIGRTVMLVDADVARPSILHYLGLQGAELGLLDVLGGHVGNLSDVILRTDVPNLTVVPAGRNYSQSTELLASDAMAALGQEMAERYPDRIVLFDSPPLLATTEASVLATHMGQILVVVQAMRTAQNAVSSALEQIEGCDVVMTMLNRVTRLPGLDYQYGYGYGYGSYGS